MTDLPPFSLHPLCPKCGGTRIRVFWQQAIADPLGGRDLPECVIRTCKRCYYDWRELPLDATPGSDERAELTCGLVEAARIVYELLENACDLSMRDGEVALLGKTLADFDAFDAASDSPVLWRHQREKEDATDPDDEPEDAYLDAKLAAQTPPDAQKPASAARQAETGIRDHIDRHDAVESNFERLTTCAREAPSERDASSEPSIPVSRIVAVLAERIDRWTRNSDGASDSRVFWGDLECRAVANELGFTDALDAELARRKGTA